MMLLDITHNYADYARHYIELTVHNKLWYLISSLVRCDVLAACDTSSRLSLVAAFDNVKNKFGAITMATLFKSILLA